MAKPPEGQLTLCAFYAFPPVISGMVMAMHEICNGVELLDGIRRGRVERLA